MKGTVSAQKALQGCETETREWLGGTEENRVSPTRDQKGPFTLLPPFLQKRKQKIIELVARPASYTGSQSYAASC